MKLFGSGMSEFPQDEQGVLYYKVVENAILF